MSIFDIGIFQILQRQGYKVRRDSTLNCWKKKDLIDLIRSLENNWAAALERCENQYKQLCGYHERQDIYRWHDLRKNPEDLPNGNWDKKLLCVVIKNVKRYYSVMSYRRAEFLHEKPTSHDKIERLGFLEQVIAWRYIEPFEEVEE